MISGNMVGSYSQIGKTFIITDEDGNELTGVVVSQETLFDATDNDVREGIVYASDGGVSTGTKHIPGYRTTAGRELIAPGGTYSIPLSSFDQYDYTKFHCIISLVDLSDMNNSVNTNMIILNDCVYAANSTDKLADVTKNAETKSVELNMTNDSANYYFIYYFTYREEE